MKKQTGCFDSAHIIMLRSLVFGLWFVIFTEGFFMQDKKLTLEKFFEGTLFCSAYVRYPLSNELGCSS